MTADFLDGGLAEGFSVEVDLPDAPLPKIEADEFLLRRAVNNLLTNCVRHNATGCAIRIGGRAEAKQVVSLRAVAARYVLIGDKLVRFLCSVDNPADNETRRNYCRLWNGMQSFCDKICACREKIEVCILKMSYAKNDIGETGGHVTRRQN